jgi:hypothetical protein
VQAEPKLIVGYLPPGDPKVVHPDYEILDFFGFAVRIPLSDEDKLRKMEMKAADVAAELLSSPTEKEAMELDKEFREYGEKLKCMREDGYVSPDEIEVDNPHEIRRYDDILQRFICPFLETTQCKALWYGYKHKQSLNSHLTKKHPALKSTLIATSWISFTNAHATAVNAFLKQIKALLKGTLPGVEMTEDQALITSYNATKNKQDQEDDDVDDLEELIPKKERAAFDKQRCVKPQHNTLHYPWLR